MFHEVCCVTPTLPLCLSVWLSVCLSVCACVRACVHVCVATGSPASQVHEKLYRLGSVAQDTCMCLWDLVMEEDLASSNTATGGTGGLK